MESYEDTCAVAASIVALTEKALPDIEAVAKTLVGNGIVRERVGAVVRALSAYAGAGDAHALSKLDLDAPDAAKPGWWTRLFG